MRKTQITDVAARRSILRESGQKNTRHKWTRKNVVIDQYKLDLAKTLLHASTETATIDQALDLVAFQKEVLAGIDRMAAVGGIEDMYEDR